MFNVGGMELVVIGVLGLVVLGPQRLPQAVRQVAALLGQVRQVSDGFRSELTSALQPLDDQPVRTVAVERAAPLADPETT